GRHDAGEWPPPVRPGMDLEHVPPALVQPGNYDDVVSGPKSVKSLCGERAHFKPGVGRALRTLFGCFTPFLDCGSDHADRTKLAITASRHRCPCCASFLLECHREILLRPDHYLPLHIYIIAIAMTPLSRRHFLQGMSSLLALPLARIEEPEIILYNGNIWTVDPAQPRAQAVAITGARFFAVGTNAEVLPLATARTRKIDLAFKTVLPGFNDAHSHPAESGVEHLRKVACDKDSIEKIQGALHERALQTPPGQWVLGFLYDDGKTPRPINRHDLDAAVP